MKRIIVLLLVISSLSATAQKSVLLRLDYDKGDNYVVNVEIKQDMGPQGGMNMNMTMGMSITEVGEEKTLTESKITSFTMDMLQGGMSMGYDSNKKEEELDQMGKMMKIQFDPMMKATIHTSYDKYGNTIDTKIVPSIPSLEKLSGNTSDINYPKEKVSVGSSWSSEDTNQGLKMITTYTVSNIENGNVYLDISGDVSGTATGNVKGTTTVLISSGIQKDSNLEINMSTNGVNINMVTKSTMTKK